MASMEGVLRVTVSHMPVALPDEVLLQVFGPYGGNKVYVLERTSRMVAYIFFHPDRDASEAQRALHGRNIYDNCCCMDVEVVLRSSTHSSGVQATKTAIPGVPPPSTPTPLSPTSSMCSTSTTVATAAAASPMAAAPSGRDMVTQPLDTAHGVNSRKTEADPVLRARARPRPRAQRVRRRHRRLRLQRRVFLWGSDLCSRRGTRARRPRPRPPRPGWRRPALRRLQRASPLRRPQRRIRFRRPRRPPRSPRPRRPRRAPPRPPRLYRPRRPLPRPRPLPRRLRRAWRVHRLRRPRRARLREPRRAPPRPPASPTCCFLGSSDPRASKELLAEACKLVFPSRLLLAYAFVKDAESCWYMLTNCSTQVLNGNNYHIAQQFVTSDRVRGRLVVSNYGSPLAVFCCGPTGTLPVQHSFDDGGCGNSGMMVFEVLSLSADVFCNISIDLELLSHMSLEVDQYQPWPPPDELTLMSSDAGLHRLIRCVPSVTMVCGKYMIMSGHSMFKHSTPGYQALLSLMLCHLWLQLSWMSPVGACSSVIVWVQLQHNGSAVLPQITVLLQPLLAGSTGYTSFIQLLQQSGANFIIHADLGGLPMEIAAMYECKKEAEHHLEPFSKEMQVVVYTHLDILQANSKSQVVDLKMEEIWIPQFYIQAVEDPSTAYLLMTTQQWKPPWSLDKVHCLPTQRTDSEQMFNVEVVSLHSEFLKLFCLDGFNKGEALCQSYQGAPLFPFEISNLPAQCLKAVLLHCSVVKFKCPVTLLFHLIPAKRSILLSVLAALAIANLKQSSAASSPQTYPGTNSEGALISTCEHEVPRFNPANSFARHCIMTMTVAANQDGQKLSRQVMYDQVQIAFASVGVEEQLYWRPERFAWPCPAAKTVKRSRILEFGKRLEGKPHFKQRGMSGTGPLNGLPSWAFRWASK